jgi:hypothetical protein
MMQTILRSVSTSTSVRMISARISRFRAFSFSGRLNWISQMPARFLTMMNLCFPVVAVFFAVALLVAVFFAVALLVAGFFAMGHPLLD